MANIKKLHPGVYIKDSLETMNMTSKEFSLRTGISERTLSAIINEKGNITFEVAYKLATFFDSSVDLWMNLQNQYDLYLLETEKEKEINDDWELIKGIKKYLLEQNYICAEDSKKDIVDKTRKLIGVNSLSLLNVKDPFVCFREQHYKKENNYFYQNFWIALALNEARKKMANNFNKEKILSSIKEIRSMTVNKPDIFYPRLVKIMSECGISFVFLPYLPKSNIYGATKWFSRNNVMLAISNRGERADLFWFTLFHELSHLLMEHRRETLISFSNVNDFEADRMAFEMLIPKKEWDPFIKKGIYTIDSIERFSRKIGILPLIVLGRLHKEFGDCIPYSMLDNYFYVSYKIQTNK